MARNCRAYLVAIEKAEDSGRFVSTVYSDALLLAWSCREEDSFDPIDLPSRVPHYFNILSTRGISNNYRLEIEKTPYRYLKLLSEIGTYRFTIMVSGENVKPEGIRIIFHWNGVWDKYVAEENGNRV